MSIRVEFYFIFRFQKANSRGKGLLHQSAEMKGEERKKLERWVRQDGAKEVELFLQQLRGIEEIGGKEWH